MIYVSAAVSFSLHHFRGQGVDNYLFNLSIIFLFASPLTVTFLEQATINFFFSFDYDFEIMGTEVKFVVLTLSDELL